MCLNLLILCMMCLFLPVLLPVLFLILTLLILLLFLSRLLLLLLFLLILYLWIFNYIRFFPTSTPVTTNVHPMITRSKASPISFSAISSSDMIEPSSYKAAFLSKAWYKAMDEEYQALQ